LIFSDGRRKGEVVLLGYYLRNDFIHDLGKFFRVSLVGGLGGEKRKRAELDDFSEGRGGMKKLGKAQIMAGRRG